ncbi:MFS transporter [Paenibacillus cymbidii]|uniref:MFS transporter n=1 Tax=Paenibacillus cymbidii TaxID=1639034 RepID=UPI001080DE4B|nr:MFS transporter [Paenibacillus cymbidii]
MNRPIVLASGLNFTYYTTTAVLTPLLPLYLAAEGYSKAEIGLFMMVGPFVAVFAQPIWGFLSDRFHTTKRIIYLLWLLTVASSVGLFTTHSFSLTFTFMLLLYFFMLPSTPLLDSMSIKIGQQAGVSYGSIRLWGSVGFSTFAIVAGLLLPLFGGITHIGWMYWIIWLVPLSLLAFQRDEQRVAGRKPITFRSMNALLRDRRFVWFLAMVFLLSVPHRMNDAQFGLFITDLGASPWMVSLGWSLAAMSEVPTFALLSRFIQRFHELPLLGIVSGLFTMRWILYALIDDPWVLMFAMTLHAVTYAAFWIIAVQYVMRLVPADMGSSGQSLLSASFIGLAGITGGFLGGWMQQTFGGGSMYGYGAILSGLAMLLFFATHARMRRKEARQASSAAL